MIKPVMLAGLMLAAVPLAGCASNGYGYSQPYAYSGYSYPRSYGWYDGYYGSVYDGYWGQGGYYYYRTHDRDRWQRDNDHHFRQGATSPGSNWQRYERAAPSWRGPDGGHAQGQARGNGRGHHHGRH
ncbi:MAG: hypothetical protein JSR96_11505 [Proteobacteria bacterium]|nr:hypothetical protein [Pseudomonadota bacterium]